MFNEMIEGEAHKPFVYRMLAPTIVRTISAILPANFVRDINNWGVDNLTFLTSGTNNIKLVYFIISVGLWYFSIIGFALVLKRLALYYYPQSINLSFILPLVAVAGLPIFFKYYSYIYDFTHLFLFTLSLYLMSKSSWKMYLFIFCLTTLNKETSVLLILIFILHYKEALSKLEFNRLLLTQVSFFLIIKVFLTIYYAGNPGSVIEFHVVHNLKLEAYSISQFVTLIIIGIAVAHDWKAKPLFLKRSFSIIIPLLILTFFLGFLDEYRDYYELYPIILLLISHSALQIFKIHNKSTITPNKDLC
ncbi:MAG: hypothetical protein K9H48_15750 [Melioribacteraceae bacterium]|nr:hypothetical protein [Melioribacteraceae bacterium]MCF8395447.1 hypothetical protein [Melioribacteraceae bacterium]